MHKLKLIIVYAFSAYMFGGITIVVFGGAVMSMFSGDFVGGVGLLVVALLLTIPCFILFRNFRKEWRQGQVDADRKQGRTTAGIGR